MKSARILSLAATLCVAVYAAQAQTFEIDWHTVDGGGEMLTSGGEFELSGTIGQHDAGPLTGGNFELVGGFWPVGGASGGPPCDACDANCDGSVDLTDVEPFILLQLGGDPCDSCTGDTTGDGSVDLTDVEGFIECLLG